MTDSSEAPFRTAGALALRAAAERAKPSVLEPLMDVEVDVPDDAVGEVVGDLNGRRGRLGGMDPGSKEHTVVHATVPMATMGRYALDMRSITKGRGRFRAWVSRCEEVPLLVQEKLVAQFARTRGAEA